MATVSISGRQSVFTSRPEARNIVEAGIAQVGAIFKGLLHRDATPAASSAKTTVTFSIVTPFLPPGRLQPLRDGRTHRLDGAGESPGTSSHPSWTGSPLVIDVWWQKALLSHLGVWR